MRVFVLSSENAWVGHGPVRGSEKQALAVAAALRRRLGWVVAVGVVAPAPPAVAPADCPPPALAGLSPVWKDPGLAARWAAGARAPRPVAEKSPVAPVAESSRLILPGVPVPGPGGVVLVG